MLDWCRASGLAPGKRQQASAFQGLRPAGSEGASWERGWQAHSVRRESCNADSSPEPSAAGSEGATQYGVGAILDGNPGVSLGTREGKKTDLCGVWASRRKRSQARCPCHFWGRAQEDRPLGGGRGSGVEVGVFVGFFCDGGAFAVAREDDGGWGEGEDFAADACDEEGVAAAGEVGAADAAGHEGIAGEGAGAGGVDEDEAVGGVAGDVGDGELEAGDGEGLAEEVAEGVVDWVVGDIEGGAGPLADERFESVFRGAGVPCVDRGTGGGDGGGVHDVVEVGVGEEEGGWLDIFLGEEVGHAFGGVDDDPSIGGFEGESVGGGDAAGEHEDLVHGARLRSGKPIDNRKGSRKLLVRAAYLERHPIPFTDRFSESNFLV